MLLERKKESKKEKLFVTIKNVEFSLKPIVC